MTKETYLDLRKLQRTLDGLADTFETLRLPGPPGEPGENGLDADPAYIRELVKEAVDPAFIKQLVDAAVALFPKPENGKDADPAVIQAMVAKAVARLPKPENGKDADPEAIQALVAQAFSALRVPQAGKPGRGVPAGGEPGYILAKLSEEDYDTHWIKLPAGAAGSFSMWNGLGGGTSTLFGVGDPSSVAANGTLYFDTTDPDAYAGWVYNGGAWRAFVGAAGSASNWILHNGTWHDTGVWDDGEVWEDS